MFLRELPRCAVRFSKTAAVIADVNYITREVVTTFHTVRGFRSMICNNKNEWAPTIPYTSLYIDASWSDFIFAAKECIKLCQPSTKQIKSIKKDVYSYFVTDQNPNPAIVCLSVRTGFDLFFRVKKFPAGSEVIMTAINIPTMVEIVHYHNLKPVAWDVNPRTLKPNVDDLKKLINDKTVVIIYAHLFAKWCRDLEPFLEVSRRQNLFFIEDCAETFLGFDYLGHPASDMILYSFGIIKFCTSFGGAVVKIRDRNLLNRMETLYEQDPLMSNVEYFEKLVKYRFVAMGLNVPTVIRYGVPFFRAIGVDHKQAAVNLLRGFPRDEMIRKIRHRPCAPLLTTLRRRLANVDSKQFALTKEKGDFVELILTALDIMIPGCDVESKNYWLFPIIVDNPVEFVSKINRLGVDAFTKASQLGVVDDVNPETSAPMANKMLKHLVYLPVHKNVPYDYLCQILNAVRQCVANSDNSQLPIKSKL